ncbi:hypothetical protein DV736_g2510, partial [Chaetothyriales sp. CBS 134916]
MTTLIEILGVSSADVPTYDVIDSHTPGKSLHCRISTRPQEFDTMEISLDGCLYSLVGPHIASEQIMHTSQSISRSDFYESMSAKGLRVNSLLYCEVSLELDGSVSCLNLNGTTGDEETLGYCELLYSLQANFRNKSGAIIQQVNCPVDLSKLIKSARMTLLAPGCGSYTRESLVRSWGKSLCSRRYSPLCKTKMAVEVPHALGVVATTPTESGRGYQQLSIPLTLLVPKATKGRLPQSVENVSIQANWYTSKAFGTSPHTGGERDPDSNIQQCTVVRQLAHLSFPPFFGEEPVDESSYTSTTYLDLTLPDSISKPSVKTSLAELSYELELEGFFEVKSQRGRRAPYRSKMRLPIEVNVS